MDHEDGACAFSKRTFAPHRRLPLSNIYDLWPKELARADGALLIVTPTAPPPLHHVSYSLLCLLKAEVTAEIGWDGANVGQEVLVQT